MATERSERLAVFAQLLGQLRDPLLIASRDGRVQAANVASADALGTSVKALDGASLATYTSDPSALAAKLRRPSLELQVPVRAPDGRRFACDASTLDPDLLLVRLSPGEREVMEEVTSAARAQGAGSIGAAAQRLERLHSFTKALAQAITPAQVAEAVVDMGMAATAATAVELWVLGPDPSTVRLSLGRGASGLPSEGRHDVSLDRSSRTPILDAIRDGAPVWIESRRQLGDRYPDVSFTDERSMTCLPLFAQGRCIGGLSLSFTGVRRFVEDERAFLQVISWHSAQAVERAYLYSAARRARDEAEESRRRSDFLADVGSLLSSSLDAKDILKSVAAAAVPAMADWCLVRVSSDCLERMTFASHIERSKTASLVEMINRLSALGFGPFTQDEDSVKCKAISINIVRSQFDEDPALAALMTEVGAASALFVPISARGTVLGSIVLNRNNPGRAYDERDLATAEDLGRRVGLAVDNARLYQESREADRLKDEFLAMLSHELRNPLAPILTAIELMNLQGNETFSRERAVIARHVHQTVRLVDDLFDVSRITRGKVQLSKHPCQLSTVVATAMEMVTPLCEKRRHVLRLEAPPEPLFVNGDQPRLAQAIGNVLTNAAKYTPAGGDITVTITSNASDAIVTVRDNGNGIAPALLPRVFDLFVQGETPLDRTPGGLGIGLTIVQRIVGMHDGSVSAHSDGVGHGSEFIVRLPRILGTVTTPKPTSHRPPLPTTTERRVLIVDDNQDAAVLLGEALAHLGWSVETAHDGHAALEIATAFRPQLVLLDIGLPVMDGYELARNLRRLDLDPNLRLVAVTGYGQASDRARSAEAGFDNHVVKPVDLNTLRRVLEGVEGVAVPPSVRSATA